jgi:hypothetical protein
MAPAAHAQRYLVNGHPATAGEEQILASNGFDAGAWRMDGWGISLDAEHANFRSPSSRRRCGLLAASSAMSSARVNAVSRAAAYSGNRDTAA